MVDSSLTINEIIKIQASYIFDKFLVSLRI